MPLHQPLSMNLVAADVSPRHSLWPKISADSRRRLRFRGSKRDVLFRIILTLILSPCEEERKTSVAVRKPGHCEDGGHYRISSPLIG